MAPILMSHANRCLCALLVISVTIAPGCQRQSPQTATVATPQTKVEAPQANDNEPQPITTEEPTAAPDASVPLGTPSSLPLPSTLSTNEFEPVLFQFLKDRKYIDLKWRKDKSVRDSGPYIDKVYYGTHPAVRVYYSPGIVRWLMSGRQGTIPDGEMIIKEQYAPPAARHHGKTEAELRESLESWTVMVKDAAGSRDGWFWSNPGADAKPFDYHANNKEPYSGFGLYCVRCHASTQSPSATAVHSADNEFTFAALSNIEGFPGEPILFRVDDSWRHETKSEPASEHAEPVAATKASQRKPRQDFLDLYGIKVGDPAAAPVPYLPASSHDSVPAPPHSEQGWMTSNQCMNCHAGLTGPLGPVGFRLYDEADNKKYGAKGVNVSPYGEWRWTPMGLAGRDPIFYAQLETEIALLKRQFGEGADCDKLCNTLSDTCLRCHGSQAHHQFHQDQPRTHTVSVKDSRSHSELGALAREGIGCMICHRLQPRPQPDDDTRPYLSHFLETSITGNLYFGEAGKIFGPYKDDEITSYAMHHATGIKPTYSPYIQSSQMCGTCHTVSLPLVSRPLSEEAATEDKLAKADSVLDFRKYHHHLEQATYLEWLNSKYNNELDPKSATGQSCQDCHMPDHTFADEAGDKDWKIQTRIAAIQDHTYPHAENLPPEKLMRVAVRKNYRRHSFAGLNVWLLEMHNQFDDVLGVKKTDYMTGSDQGAAQAIAGMQRTATRQTATVKVDASAAQTSEKTLLSADVRVTNLTGHRFPSGVGFRRAFLEFTVLETDEDGNRKTLWSSGKSNQLGVILGEGDKVLESEFFGEQPKVFTHQPHHELITSQNQVQIYETLLCDNFERYTTSFVRGCNTVKDNRLLPNGWSKEGPGGGLTGAYLHATWPGPDASKDTVFTDGSGSDVTQYRVELPAETDPSRLEVEATLYYQAIPPYFLNNLFRTAPDGEATRLLHALTSRMDLSDTPIAGWKLKIATDRADFR